MSVASIMTTSTRDVSDFLSQLTAIGKLHKQKVITTSEFENLKKGIMTQINPFSQTPSQVFNDEQSVSSSLGVPSPFHKKREESKFEFPVNHPMRKPWVQKLAVERGKVFKYENFISAGTEEVTPREDQEQQYQQGQQQIVARVSPPQHNLPQHQQYNRVSPQQQYPEHHVRRVSPPQHHYPSMPRVPPPQHHHPSMPRVSPPQHHQSQNMPRVSPPQHQHQVQHPPPQHHRISPPQNHHPPLHPPIHDPTRVPLQPNKSIHYTGKFKPPVPVPKLNYPTHNHNQLPYNDDTDSSHTSRSTSSRITSSTYTPPPSHHPPTRPHTSPFKPKNAPSNYSPHKTPLTTSTPYYKLTFYNSLKSYDLEPEIERLPKLLNGRPVFTKPPPEKERRYISRSAPNSGRKSGDNVQIGPPYSSR
ncbi:hypothetical protein TrLO_g10089 [Triparma laevis f. longispina]|uniref:Uncharacterized protein n=1 Tax=Triparma laevis f. longispina TaxID=1714387 RepID=A0A9W7KTT8_9STRA|nr:hypothetical protein TrLO_g10089 [Triparma laevis f. longispina]